jgi:uncharacterized protein YecT (DUF1311 family)
MRTITLIGVGLAVCLPLLALAASTDPVLNERALREECSAFSQAGMRDCLAKKADESQKALKQIEDNVVSVLSKWDEDNKYISLAKAKLARSSKEFTKYRETQCEFSVSLSGGAAGNTHQIKHLACVAELNSRRTEQLRNGVANLPIK